MTNYLLLKFLQFRIKQVSRLFAELGLVRLFLLITVLLVFIGFKATDLPEQAFLLVLFYLLLILPFHFSREDHTFLRKLALPKEAFFAAEYNVLVFPYSVLLMYKQRWEAILLGHILVTLFIFIPSITINKKRSTNSLLTKSIPKHLFEWRCYLRQRKVFFLVCYFLTILLSFYSYVVPIGILIFLTAMPEVYNHLESKEVIETYPKYSSFLRTKLKDHSLFIHLLFLPLYLLFLVFHYEIWYILVVLLLIIESSVCFCLFYKYSRFNSSTSVIHNQIPFAIFFISLLLFFPIGIFFVYLYWRKVHKTLPEYVRN